MSASRAHAQAGDSSIVVAAGFTADAYVETRAPVTLTLSRMPAAAEGRLAVVIGNSDMSALFERVGNTLRFRAGAFRLPSGEQEVAVFLVSTNGWQELARLPIRVLTPAGFRQATLSPAMTFNNKGQLAEDHSGTAPAPERATFQDFGATGGFQTTHARGDFIVQTQVNIVGVSNRREALRFSEQAGRASKVDLGDYRVRVEGRGATFTVGQASFGSSRHLINGFGSRGLTLSLRRGIASLSMAALNGSSIVGWDNIAGLNHSDHRLSAAQLGVEFMPQRPGGLRMDVSLLDGSVRPSTGYSTGGVASAERSEGASVQLSGSALADRIRFSGGYASSRYRDGVDPQLDAGENVVGTARRKGARFGELSLGLLQGTRVLGITTSLTANVRHERVDPLYRSLGAYAQADVDQRAIDINGSIDALNLQVSGTRMRDNLDDIASILTTKTHGRAAQLNTSLAQLLRIETAAQFWPTIAIAWNRTRQFGAGIPSNSGFQATHVPDQVSTVRDYGAQWNASRWRVGFRHSRSFQDNRQEGRTAADLSARANALSLGVTAHSALDVGIETAFERQQNHELKQLSRVRRYSLTGDWRVFASTAVSGSISLSRSYDEPMTSDTRNVEGRLELQHQFDLLGSQQSGKRGQLFLRFARQSAHLRSFGDPAFVAPPQESAAWTMSSGFNFRVF
ncbi:MAG: hypothetical protein ACT443_04115 [Gemmatimonadota bacterium]